MRRFTITLLGACVLVAVLAGCFGGEATPVPIPMAPAIDCQGVPERTCQEIVTEARRNAPQGTVAVTIKAACIRPPCTAENGEVEIAVMYSNGDTHMSNMGWMQGAEPGGAPDPGEPVVAGDPVCLGVPEQTCRDMATSAASNNPEGLEVTSITVRCRAVPCTTTTGSGDTVVVFADGTSFTSEWTYENAAPS